MGEHFVGRENARDRPQNARVGVVGAARALLEPAHVAGLQGGHDVGQGRVVLAGSLAVVGVHHVQVLQVGNAAGRLQGLHRLVGDDDNHGRGRHGVVLQLRVIQRAGQCVLFAGDGHGGGGVQHGTGQGLHDFHIVRQSAGARLGGHGLLALQRAGAVEVGQRHNGQVRRAHGAQIVQAQRLWIGASGLGGRNERVVGHVRRRVGAHLGPRAHGLGPQFRRGLFQSGGHVPVVGLGLGQAIGSLGLHLGAALERIARRRGLRPAGPVPYGRVQAGGIGVRPFRAADEHLHKPHARGEHRDGEEQQHTHGPQRQKRRVHLAGDLAYGEQVQLAQVHAAHPREHGDGEAGERQEEQKRSYEHADGGSQKFRLIQHHQAVFDELLVGVSEDGDGCDEPHEADPRVAHAGALVLLAGADEVDELAAAHGDGVEGGHHHVNGSEAGERDEEGVGGEHELVVGHRRAEQRGGEKRQSLGEQHAADEAHGQGKQPHEHRLVQHDARHMARRHAQHQVGAELPLAAADEELVGVQNEEAQHAGHHHGEHAQDVGGGIEHAARGRGFHIEEDLLAADGVERVEHRHTEQQRDEVDGVVAHRSADVAQGELKIHGRPPRRGTTRPP